MFNLKEEKLERKPNGTHNKVRKVKVQITTISGDNHYLVFSEWDWQQIFEHPEYVSIPGQQRYVAQEKKTYVPHRLVERIEFEYFDEFEVAR